jgi:hypothetical protein
LLAFSSEEGLPVINELNTISRTIAAMPPAALMAVQLLAAFALAAYAIYAVLTVTKGKR